MTQFPNPFVPCIHLIAAHLNILLAFVVHLHLPSLVILLLLRNQLCPGLVDARSLPLHSWCVNKTIFIADVIMVIRMPPYSIVLIIISGSKSAAGGMTQGQSMRYSA